MANGKSAAEVLCSFMVAALLVASANGADVTSITGKIIFKGDPAKHAPKVVNTSKDPACKKQITSEKVVLNGKSAPFTMRNVLVHIKHGLGDRDFATRRNPIRLTQRNCRFEPHVLALPATRPLRVLNADETKADVHFHAAHNHDHTFTIPGKDLKKGKEVGLSAEPPFRVTSDLHPWMECYIAVFRHPFFDLTGLSGTYEILGMPAGEYLLEAWHEELGTLTATVQVRAGEQTRQDFTFTVK